MIRRLLLALAAWIERNLVADDPAPEISRLDRLDGRSR